MATCAALAIQLDILEHLLTTTSNQERRQQILDAIDDIKNQQASQGCLTPTCDELAAQVSSLQTQLAEMQAEIDNPEAACESAGVDPGSDACIEYLKGLRREVGALQNAISNLELQQQQQGCLT
jgi:predicted RNase H-like nuclease (RuvC/YqgF family)